MQQTKACLPTSLILFPSYTSPPLCRISQSFRITLLLTNRIITQSLLFTYPHPVLCPQVKMYGYGTRDFGYRYREDYDARVDEHDHWVECETCPRAFQTKRSCEQHMDALSHWAPVFECETCPRTFSSQASANQHMNSKNHWKPTIPCETCSQMFHTHEAADQHMEAKGHYKNYCAECDRCFPNENCLRHVREPSQSQGYSLWLVVGF